MEELIERFKNEAKERVGAIEELLEGLSAAGDPREHCNSIREEAHKLKGAAGVLGFPDFKDRASDLEEIAAARCDDLNGDLEDAQQSMQPATVALRNALP